MERFVGRARDVEALRVAVERGARLVTIVSPGGMGKTRLARELVAELAPRYDDSAFVDLTEATSMIDLVTVMAASLGLPSPDDGTESEARANLARAINAKPHMLIVLDNFEHLLPHGAELVATWTSAQLIVTSRERLRVTGEVVYELGPLDEGVELFVARATAVEPTFSPTPTDLATIARIVETLDGIPLAIELAAARTRVLSPADLLARLADRFAVLSGGPHDAPRRQATMYDAIEWSWTLLDENERAALVTATVFRGGFTLDAFEVVFGQSNALDLVQSLRDKSLVVEVATSPRGERRLGMYESIREFAATKLEPATAATLHARHARWAIAHREDRTNLEAVLGNALHSPSREMIELAFQAVGELDTTGDAITSGQARMLDALLAVDVATDPRARVRARLARAARLAATAQLDEASHEAASALAAAQASADTPLIALAATRLTQARFRAGHNDEAIEHARTAIEASRATADHVLEARALTIEGAALSSLRRAQESLALYEEVLSLSRRFSDPRGQLEAEAGIAFYHLERGFHEHAREHYERALELARATDTKRMALLITGYLGLLELDRGRAIEALELATAAVAQAHEFGELRAEGTFLAIAAAARAQLDDLAAAELAADAAEHLLAAYPTLLEVARIYRGIVELARCRQAASRGDNEAAGRYRAAARARIAAAAARRLGERSDDARVAIRILTSALDPARTSIPPVLRSERLIVGWQGAWFTVGDGARVDLSRRATLRALLWSLVESHEAQPDTPVSIDQLIATAWPEQKLLRSSALNRLHVALATLRSLGLKDVIGRREDGYLLTTTLSVQIKMIDDDGSS